MPQNPLQFQFSDEDQPQKESSRGRDLAGTAVRTTAGMWAPTAVRIGSGLASSLGSLVPGVGTAVAGGIGAGGEAIAQLIENKGDWHKLNKKRIALEGALSAVPLGKAASFTRAALKGGALATAGVVGRKATSEDAEEKSSAFNPFKWGAWDAANIGLGGAIGGAFGKGKGPTGPAAPKITPDDILSGKVTAEALEAHLKAGKLSVNDIERLAARADALDKGDVAQNIRLAAAKTDKGNVGIYQQAAAKRQGDVGQEAKNSNAAQNVTPELPPIDQVIPRGAKTVEEIALRAEAQGNAKYAQDLRAAAVKSGISSSTTSRAVIRGTKQAATQSEKEAKAARAAEEVARRKGLLGDDLEEKVSYRDSVSAETPQGGRESATITLRPKAEEGLEGGATGKPAPKAGPKLPKPMEGLYQIVNPQGKVIMSVDDPTVAEQVLNKLGPTHAVVPPSAPGTIDKTSVTGKGGVKIPVVKKQLGPNEPFDKVAEVRSKIGEPTPTTIDPKGEIHTRISSKPAPFNAPKMAPAKPVKPATPAAGKTIKGTPMQVKEQLADVDQDTLGRLRIIDPVSGKPTFDPEKVVAEPRGVALDYNSETGGWNKGEFAPGQDVVRKETTPKGGTLPPYEGSPYQHPDFHIPTSIEPGSALRAAHEKMVREELDSIQDPVVRAMAERELGIKTAPEWVGKGIDPPPTPHTPGAKWPEELDRPDVYSPPENETIVDYLKKFGKDEEGSLNLGGIFSRFFGKKEAPVPMGPREPTPMELGNRGIAEAEAKTGSGLHDELIERQVEEGAKRRAAGTDGANTPEGQALDVERREIERRSVPRDTPDRRDPVEKYNEEFSSKNFMGRKQAPEPARDARVAEMAQREGGQTLGFGLGGANGIMEAVRNNPNFAARLGSTAAGAGIGAATSEDPMAGAVMGGSLGFLGAPLAQRMMSNPGGMLPDNATAGNRLVNWQRFALLSNPYNLMVNIAAPAGGGTMSSLEKILQGAIENRNTWGDEATGIGDLGRAGLKNIFSRERAGKFFGEDLDEAKRLLREEGSTERADVAPSAGTALDRVMEFPALAMTTGDTSIRGALKDGGWSDDAARMATNTNEPRYALTHALVNMARSGGNIGRFLLPFSRTAANVIEGSAERIPILGLALRKASDNPELQASWSELAARQGMGAVVSAVAYEMGTEIDQETSRNWKMPVLIANLSGQYGALAAAAFAAGQASQLGDSKPRQLLAAGKSYLDDLPLPTTESPYELGRAAADISDGMPPNPTGENAVSQWVPDPLLPRLFKDQGVTQGVKFIFGDE